MGPGWRSAARSFFISVTRDSVSLLGSAITTASAVLIATLFTLGLVGFEGGPYIGILAYLVLPGCFLLGLLLIPVGVVRERRRARRSPGDPAHSGTFPVLDFNRDAVRRTALVFLALSLVNVVILATVTYKGVEVMDSTEFCGTACHSVMHPEYMAYTGSPHARVKCVSCHIGPGADWFVKSKLSGAWQVVSVALDLYPRPIPTPIENLRPARETCEQCHWPDQFVGDKLRVTTHYADDEDNTEMKTVLLLRVGGIEGRKAHGIHWHVSSDNRIRYRSDPTRETVHEVELTLPDGTVKTFYPPEALAQDANGAVTEPPSEQAWRVMDCVDCHNRPTHVYDSPERAIDRAIREGRIDRALPYVRREGLRALLGEYDSHEQALREIGGRLAAYYRDNYPDVAQARPESIAQAAAALGDAYRRNVFPQMKVGWNTYPDHIGHQNSPGCFRCHNDEHRTVDGETISQDCFTCHTLLAVEEEDPAVLRDLQP